MYKLTMATLIVVFLMFSGMMTGESMNAELTKAKLEVTGVKVSVSPEQYTGHCPKKFTFTGLIMVRGNGLIQYYWERSDGNQSPVKKLAVQQSGIRTVRTTWSLSGSMGSHTYWQRLKIISPNTIKSNRAEFTLTCLPIARLRTYRISGIVAAANDGHLIAGRKVRVILHPSGMSSRSVTLTLDVSGRADYAFGGPLMRPGNYSLRVEKVESVPADVEGRANVCLRSVSPEFHRVTLSTTHSNVTGQNFTLGFAVAFDRRGICW